MKKVAGTLKLDQAQFRELEAFSKFGSDLDATTKLTIERGRRNQEILKQPQYSPVSVANQVAIIYASTKGLMDSVPVDQSRAFEKEFYTLLESTYPEALTLILKGDIDGAGKILATAASELAPKYAK
jgi:F-type H+-transporting ATPase subunit alpha